MSFHQIATILSGLWPLAPAALVLIFVKRRVIFDWCAKGLQKRLHSIPWLEDLIAHLNHAPALYVGYVGYAVLKQQEQDYIAIALATLTCLAVHRICFGLRMRLGALRAVAQSEWIDVLVKVIPAKQDQNF